MANRPSASTLKNKATRLHSEIVRGRGRCEAQGYDGQGCAGPLETAHIVSRRYSATRTDLDNALCLCSGHHRYFTADPIGWTRFVDGYLGVAKADGIRAKAHAGVDGSSRLFWLDEVERLTEVRSRLP